MESPWPEKLSDDQRRKAINELVRGRDFTVELQNLLQKPLRDGGLVSAAEDLVVKVLRSFTETLYVLNCSESDGVCQNSVTTVRVSSPSCDDRRDEDSGESRKSPASKDRRRGYKRRKTLETWPKITPNPFEDGYSWRKYGQKVILNAKFPRSYFRCTHKYDQGCQASKQVQKIEEDPPKYRTIYTGHHTCQEDHHLLKASQIIMDSSTPGGDSYLLSFESNNMTTKQDSYHPFFSSFSSIKQELHDVSYLLSPEELRTAFESSGVSGPTPVVSSTAGSDHGDVGSGVYSSYTASSRSLETGLMVDSVDLDDLDAMFHFDGVEFL